MTGALPIITADQRLAEQCGIKRVIFGRSGIGKTSLLKTLNTSNMLLIDLEAVDLALECPTKRVADAPLTAIRTELPRQIYPRSKPDRGAR